MSVQEESIRTAILEAHEPTIAAAVDAGRAVAVEWPGETVQNPELVVDPLRTRLDDQRLSSGLLTLLETGVRATGSTLSGQPVPAPPYLVVTSRGPICRGTLANGQRLVVELVLFDVDRRPPTYRFLDPTPADCLAVSLTHQPA